MIYRAFGRMKVNRRLGRDEDTGPGILNNDDIFCCAKEPCWISELVWHG